MLLFSLDVKGYCHVCRPNKPIHKTMYELRQEQVPDCGHPAWQGGCCPEPDEATGWTRFTSGQYSTDSGKCLTGGGKHEFKASQQLENISAGKKPLPVGFWLTATYQLRVTLENEIRTGLEWKKTIEAYEKIMRSSNPAYGPANQELLMKCTPQQLEKISTGEEYLPVGFWKKGHEFRITEGTPVKIRRRLISAGAPHADTSLPTVVSALTALPLSQESGFGLCLLVLSILPLMVILYFIRRFYKSLNAPTRRESEDFVDLEMQVRLSQSGTSQVYGSLPWKWQ